MIKPAWIRKAETYIGQREIKGVTHNPLIVQMWKWIKRGGIKNDEVPWCAAFVGACLEQVGIVSTRFESAKSYLAWGYELAVPQYGCIVIFGRDGGGHVGFVVGRDKRGRLMVLGGNQGDQVSIAPFDPSRVLGFRWPKLIPQSNISLPIIDSQANSSSNEA